MTGVQRCACILYQSRGNRIKRPTNFAMSLVTQWKEVTSRATSFGRSVLQNNPSGALMPGKVIGCGWTHVLTLLRWESSTSLMLFGSTHKGPGGQLQSKLWASLPAVYQRMPIWKICRGTLSRLRLGVFRLKGKHLRRSVKLIRTWLQRRRGRLSVALILTVGGRESSTDSECTDMEASSIASDQDRFDTAYEALQDLANDLYYIDLTRYSRGSTSEDAAGVLLVDGYEKLQEMVHLPRTWPLARLTIPLEGLSKQIDRLLEGYCFQILATNQYPEAHNGKVLQTATHLTWILAEYLSDTIAWLMRSILSHESKILFDKDIQLLLTPKFWLLPLYRELLNSARRIRPSPASERARGCTGLVKVICKENKEQKGKRKYHAGTPHLNDRGGFPQWFGSCSLMTTLHVWFPACWAPMVAERLFPWSPPEWESTSAHEGRPDSGPPHTTPQASSWHQPGQGATSSNEPMGDSDSTEVKYKIRQWSLSGATVVPVLNVTSRVFWLELDDKALLDSYGVLQEGILCDVFSQKCSAAWQGARGERLTVSVMLPGRQDADDWLNFM